MWGQIHTQNLEFVFISPAIQIDIGQRQFRIQKTVNIIKQDNR